MYKKCLWFNYHKSYVSHFFFCFVLEVNIPVDVEKYCRHIRTGFEMFSKRPTCHNLDKDRLICTVIVHMAAFTNFATLSVTFDGRPGMTINIIRYFTEFETFLTPTKPFKYVGGIL